jgi:hypothetical protein
MIKKLLKIYKYEGNFITLKKKKNMQQEKSNGDRQILVLFFRIWENRGTNYENHKVNSGLW